MSPLIKVLFLCTGNSCRSQMAEGWARSLHGTILDSYSAGIETHGLNEFAVQVMTEAGVDISGHRSKNVSEFQTVDFDYVITVCSRAHETCPLFNVKAAVIHAGFDDPPRCASRVAQRGGSSEEQLACYRDVRDEIRNYIQQLPESLPAEC